MMKLKLKGMLASLLLVGTAGGAQAAPIVVDEILASCAGATAGQWCVNVTLAGGTIGIANLTGAGGNLETNQPLPVGAAKVTTGASDSDRAEAATPLLIDANDFLTTYVLGYSYFKEAVGNLAAAPSLKIAISNPTCTAPDTDCFGQLIYEPYWNQAGSGNPPTGAWQTVAIGTSTGSGDINSGGWWWSGGFGQSSGAGGPPIRSLGEWNGLLGGDADFAGANVVNLSVGIGRFNQSNVGYFDNVSYGTATATPTTFDFEPKRVPEPATLALLGLGLAGLGFSRRKQ